MPFLDSDWDEGPSYECIENAKAIHETDKALLCRWEDNAGQAAEHWIPKSVIGDDSEVFAAGHTGKLFVAVWFAENEGL